LLDFTASLSRSMIQFKEILQDELQQLLKGEFEVVEGITIEHFAKLLDTLSGIDAWHIDKMKGIRGIALRIQTSDINYHTFTIRKKRNSGTKTEYEKRKYAIENGFLYPYFTVQAYVDKNNRLKAYAIAKTEDIITMIDLGFYKCNKTGKSQIGQSEFFIVDWKDMKEKNFKIYIHNFEN
jgi:hypothetical protein